MGLPKVVAHKFLPDIDTADGDAFRAAGATKTRLWIAGTRES